MQRSDCIKRKDNLKNPIAGRGISIQFLQMFCHE